MKGGAIRPRRLLWGARKDYGLATPTWQQDMNRRRDRHRTRLAHQAQLRGDWAEKTLVSAQPMTLPAPAFGSAWL